MEQQHVPWNFSRCGSTHTPFQLPVNCHSSKCRSSSFIVYRLPGGGPGDWRTRTPPRRTSPPMNRRRNRRASRRQGTTTTTTTRGRRQPPSHVFVLRLLLESGHQPGTLKKGGMHRQPTGHLKKGHRRCHRGCYWRANCFPLAAVTLLLMLLLLVLQARVQAICDAATPVQACVCVRVCVLRNTCVLCALRLR